MNMQQSLQSKSI